MEDAIVSSQFDEGSSEKAILALEGEISTLRSQQRCLYNHRKEAVNKILDIKGSVRVLCRIRPPIANGNWVTKQQISVVGEKVTVGSMGERKEFSVDKVFDERSSQDDLFDEIEPTLRSALDGHNVCIFAYGQTGTGKTFTMEGTNDRPGIVPRALKALFRRVTEDRSGSFSFSMSMLEIYMGALRDLLSHKHSSSMNKWNLNILASSNGFIEVEGLKDVPVANFEQANRWYIKGKRTRSTSCTYVNETSSRSHCLTRITIARTVALEKGNVVQVSKLWMVDLGGSERLLKTRATGLTHDEGKAINLSLSALGDVIAALKRKTSHIPYRNSKLTQLLSDSLGNGSNVVMVVHVSTDEDDVGETTCSLNFAKRVRAIEPNREIPQALKKHKEKCIEELNKQINDADIELKKIRNQIDRVESLLQEKKKVQSLEIQNGSPRIPLISARVEAATVSPKTREMPPCRNHYAPLPHFMASTACSRQRRGSAEVSRKFKKSISFLGTKSIDLCGSQSTSLVDSVKLIPLHLKTTPVSSETKNLKARDHFQQNVEDASCNSCDSKMLIKRQGSPWKLDRSTKKMQQHRRVANLT